MNKEEILKMSQKENKAGDERERLIAVESSENAYLAIISVNLILVVITNLQTFLTGKSFADYRVFFLAFLVGYAGKHATRYKYEKTKTELFMFILSIIGSLACLGSILLRAYR